MNFFLLAKYRATDFLIAFDPLHLRSDRSGGSSPHALFVQHLRGNKKHPETSSRLSNNHIPHEVKHRVCWSSACSNVPEAEGWAAPRRLWRQRGPRMGAWAQQVRHGQRRSLLRLPHSRGGAACSDCHGSLLEKVRPSLFYGNAVKTGNR